MTEYAAKNVLRVSSLTRRLCAVGDESSASCASTLEAGAERYLRERPCDHPLTDPCVAMGDDGSLGFCCPHCAGGNILLNWGAEVAAYLCPECPHQFLATELLAPALTPKHGDCAGSGCFPRPVHEAPLPPVSFTLMLDGKVVGRICP